MESLELAITELARNNLERDSWDTPLDYFSWGRDSRHLVDNTEALPGNPVHVVRKIINRKLIRSVQAILRKSVPTNPLKHTLSNFRKYYSSFDETYQLMSDQYSRNLFAELVFMQLVQEKNMRLSSFTQDFIDSYEVASGTILRSEEKLPVYKWMLRKITLTNPALSFYTVPTILNLHLTGKLYRYQSDKVFIGVSGGDVVIDAGVGWGDTTIYLAALANEKAGGHVYAFDILEEGMNALSEQIKENPGIENITPILRGLSDTDGDQVSISSPGPDARITEEKTGRTVETITIDTFSEQKGLDKVDLIKMDIEGAEVPALAGAANTIKQHKPKLAISVYHKWDDLLVIPQLIHTIRDDYSYYLDCTTGFGGETILYCN